MKCVNCGFESEQEFAFCTQCGKAAQPNAVPVEREPINPLLQKTLSALKSPLFLAVCILVTASVAFSLINDELSLLPLLGAIFLWIAFAKSRKDEVHAKSLRSISGVVFADYVVSYVVAGLIAVMGVLLMVVVSVAAGSTVIFNEIVNELNLMHAEYIDFVEILLSASGPLLFLVCLLVAVPIFLVNLFGTRKIHGFIKSLYQGIQDGTDTLQYAEAAKTWLLVFGIVQAISAFFSLFSAELTALSGVSLAAAMIVASVLIRKYFTENV